jgi:uncharacterized protein (TIGR00661 family)
MEHKNEKMNILVSPLNWGLGHATRCIPIIKALEKNNFNPIIATDGGALALLKKEFPHNIFIEMPAYNVIYSKKGWFFKIKLILQFPKVILAIIRENVLTFKIIKNYEIKGIISDNRLGVYSRNVPSVFITHQLTVKSGITTKISTILHAYFIRKFDCCWIPDYENKPNLSGNLGHNKLFNKNISYIGPLSRITKREIAKKYDIMVLLSGPEPQRTILEQKLINALKNYNGEILFIKGIIESSQKKWYEGKITFYNFMNSIELELAINAAEIILSRSGYTTIMDLAKVGKKALFIPTPGQYEQEYLAHRLEKEGIAPYCLQEDFTIEKLNELDKYSGFKNIFDMPEEFEKLFDLFKSKRKLRA